MCVPAEQPGGGVCTRSAGGEKHRLDSLFTLNAFQQTPLPYLCLCVDLCLIFQQEIDHFHVAVVTRHMQRRVSQLKNRDMRKLKRFVCSKREDKRMKREDKQLHLCLRV